MKVLRGILAEEVGKTSIQDADEIVHHTETWRLTVALEAMQRAYALGYDHGSAAMAQLAR